MRVVLDEALPRKLAALLQEAGCPAEPFPAEWKGMQDGPLLDNLESEDGAALLTCDRNMPFQQSLAGRRVALVILPGQRVAVLAPLVASIANAARHATLGSATTLDGGGFGLSSDSQAGRSD